MPEKLLIPKFLTPTIANIAVDNVLKAVLDGVAVRTMVSHKECAIVILVPAMKDDGARKNPDWPNYTVQPHLLYEYNYGDSTIWPYPLADIAKCKALQLWQGRNDDRTDIMPHLLFPSDTPFWGGVKRGGIVVACSGIQPYFDKMIAGMIADMCIGLAYHDWMISVDKKKTDKDACFLS